MLVSPTRNLAWHPPTRFAGFDLAFPMALKSVRYTFCSLVRRCPGVQESGLLPRTIDPLWRAP